jgi:hypothetical protein
MTLLLSTSAAQAKETLNSGDRKVVDFVATMYMAQRSCEHFFVDEATVNKIIALSGVDFRGQEAGELSKKTLADLSTIVAEKGAAQTCEALYLLFGPNGSRVGGLMTRR